MPAERGGLDSAWSFQRKQLERRIFQQWPARQGASEGVENRSQLLPPSTGPSLVSFRRRSVVRSPARRHFRLTLRLRVAVLQIPGSILLHEGVVVVGGSEISGDAAVALADVLHDEEIPNSDRALSVV